MTNRKHGPRIALRSAAFFTALGMLMGFQGLTGQTAEEEGLIARFAAMNGALAAGDMDAIAEFYAEDFVRLPPGEAAVFTHDALREEFESFQAENDYSMDEFQIRRFKVSGDLGHTLATYTDSVTPKAGGETVTTSGRWVVMWRREGGSWKITAEIWNLSPPE